MAPVGRSHATQTIFGSLVMLYLQSPHSKQPILSQPQQWCGAIKDNALSIIVIFTFRHPRQLIIPYMLVIM
ncbi:hypothetical protein CO052_01405 [Candidatus Saccharibacteria bacterium CG_4_9_14_0_2_um_filter_41_9]|nr:MAG: hypothetical protein CO052_01405 [Candidatus Saccharibacteria bacterium CG_4_9_14_0_2_um_filter_41_9]